MPPNARKLLGVPYETIEIERRGDGVWRDAGAAFAGKPADTTEENIQSRIRGLIC